MVSGTGAHVRLGVAPEGVIDAMDGSTPVPVPQSLVPHHSLVDRTAPFMVVEVNLLTHPAFSDLSPIDITVYLALKSFTAMDKSTVWPSLGTIARRAHCSESSAKRSLRTLRDAGLIRVTHTTTESGDPGSNVYELFPPSQRIDAGSQGPGGGFTQNPGVGSQGPQGWVQADPLTNTSMNKNQRELERPPEEKVTVTASGAGFGAIWAVYPRKTAQEFALAEWRKLGGTEALAGMIVADIKRRLAAKEWTDVKFVPSLGNYLAGKRWLDEPIPEAAPEKPDLTPAQLAQMDPAQLSRYFGAY